MDRLRQFVRTAVVDEFNCPCLISRAFADGLH
jgi:hypothetical protein